MTTAGVALVILGIPMLVLPGPGLGAIAVGAILIWRGVRGQQRISA